MRKNSPSTLFRDPSSPLGGFCPTPTPSLVSLPHRPKFFQPASVGEQPMVRYNDLREGDQRCRHGLLSAGEFSLWGSKSPRQWGSNQEAERNRQSEIQDAVKDGKASSPWGLPLLPSFRQAGKRGPLETVGRGLQRAFWGNSIKEIIFPQMKPRIS